jgi:hypothetical protein
MNLKFITSVSQNYWNGVGKHCISTWNLPGEVVVYVDQQEGFVDWFDEIPFKKKLLHVPSLEVSEDYEMKTKVRKFWGKSCAQFDAVRTRGDNTRVIWLDADMEQLTKGQLDKKLFNFTFRDAVAMMRSNTHTQDKYESGLVIFNQQHEKLNLFIKQYEGLWQDKDELSSLYRPYDAMVLGAVAEKRGFYNLCQNITENKNALLHTNFRKYFKHWINKENKSKLQKEKNDITQIEEIQNDEDS